MYLSNILNTLVVPRLRSLYTPVASLRDRAIAWKPFCTVKGDSLLSGFSLLADNYIPGPVIMVMNKSVSESQSSSSGLVLFTHFGNSEDPTEEAIFGEKGIHRT